VIAELGTLKGEWAQKIYKVARPRELHLVDTKIMDVARRRFADVPGVQIHHADSSAWLARYPDRYFDWIYIDADHSYQGVKRDIEVAKSKSNLLVFNDYVQWSVLQCLPYGVVAAVNELCVEDGWEMIYFAFEDLMYCDVAVRRMSGQPGGAG
jgi:hypothetical protein